MNDLAVDVAQSVRCMNANAAALNCGLIKLRIIIETRQLDCVEDVRAELLAAVDGYVDHYVAAALRIDHEKKVSDGGAR